LAESAVQHAGSVQFRPLSDGHATDVAVTLRYRPPAGRVGGAVARLLGEEPSAQIEEDLHRFKQLMETDDVPSKPRSRPRNRSTPRDADTRRTSLPPDLL
jgi:uncharacterized membrane protein